MSRTRILQLTDTHLFGSTSGRLLGANTNDSFRSIIETIKSADSDDIVPELIMVTGDLTQDHSLESYLWLKEQLDWLSVPYVWMNGNHDDSSMMVKIAPEAMIKSIVLNGWQLLFLNSQVQGEVHGEFSPSELKFLQQCLAEHPELPTMIAFHHPAYQVGCDWLNPIGLRNTTDFTDIIRQYSQVKAVINGHIHQEIDQYIEGVRYLASPSTCVQFKPDCLEFTLDDRAPGYRQLDLYTDGRLTTKVVRLNDYVQSLDLTAEGY